MDVRHFRRSGGLDLQFAEKLSGQSGVVVREVNVFRESFGIFGPGSGRLVPLRSDSGFGTA